MKSKSDMEMFCRQVYSQIGKVKDDLEDSNSGEAQERIAMLMVEVEKMILSLFRTAKQEEKM